MNKDPAVEMLLYYKDSQKRYPDSKYDFLKKAYSSDANIIITDENILLWRDEKVNKFVYECRYLKQDGVNKGVVLSVYYDNFHSSSLDAEDHFLLEELIKLLQHNKVKGIIVTKIWDASSYALCNQAYEPLAQYERLLKKLVNLAFCKIYTTDWCESYFAPIKRGITKDRVEKRAAHYSDKREIAIEVLDFYTLYKLVFETKTDKSKEVTAADETQIVKKQAISLWDNLAMELPYLVGFKVKADELVKLRDKVMHSNTLLYKEYYRIRELCRECNRTLTLAINDIDKVTISSSVLEEWSGFLEFMLIPFPMNIVYSVLKRNEKNKRNYNRGNGDESET